MELDDEECWARIEHRLDRSPVEPEWTRTRGRPGDLVRTVGTAFVGLVLVVVIGLVVRLLVTSSSDRTDTGEPTLFGDSGASGTTVVVAVVLFVAALAIWSVGAIAVLHRGSPAWWGDEPTLGVRGAERRTIARMISGRIPFDPRRWQVLRRLGALRLEQSRSLAWFLVGWIPMALSLALDAVGSWRSVMHVALAVLSLLGLAMLTSRRERWRAFITQRDPVPGT